MGSEPSKEESSSDVDCFDCPSSEEGRKEKEECAICLDNIHNERTLKCGHSFCDKCIAAWKKKSDNCPICRKTDENFFKRYFL